MLGRRHATQHGTPASLAANLIDAGVRDEDIVATAADDYPELSDILVDRPPPTIVRSAALEVVDVHHKEGKAPHEDIFNKLIDKAYDHSGFDSNAWGSIDWCRWRNSSHCFYPTPSDSGRFLATDRGVCPKKAWEDQIKCPAAEPGDNSNVAGAMPSVQPTAPHPWMPLSDPRQQPLWDNDWIQANFPPIPDNLGYVGG